jgi:hypothetical protein
MANHASQMMTGNHDHRAAATLRRLKLNTTNVLFCFMHKGRVPQMMQGTGNHDQYDHRAAAT